MALSVRVRPIVVFALIVIASSLGLTAQTMDSPDGRTGAVRKASHCVAPQAADKIIVFLLGSFDARGLSCGGHPEVVCYIGGGEV